jgi:hypothetical protein
MAWSSLAPLSRPKRKLQLLSKGACSHAEAVAGRIAAHYYGVRSAAALTRPRDAYLCPPGIVYTVRNLSLLATFRLTNRPSGLGSVGSGVACHI